jgi:hypothetical protein
MKDYKPAETTTFEHTITGLLAKRRPCCRPPSG